MIIIHLMFTAEEQLLIKALPTVLWGRDHFFVFFGQTKKEKQVK